MSEKCKHAYRKPGKRALFCRAIEGDMDYCLWQKTCAKTQRVEAMPTSGRCELKKKEAVK